MTPIWVFPAYPLLLTAPFGSNLIAAASKSGQLASLNAVAVAIASVCVQGTGFLISFMVCAAFLYRLMTQKLPRDHQRPGIFIAIGPSAFTAAGMVTLGNQTAEIFPANFNFMGTEHAIFILRLFSYMAGLWLYGLSIWFFLVSVGSLWKYVKPENRKKMPFQMTWFSFVFPNTALVCPVNPHLDRSWVMRWSIFLTAAVPRRLPPPRHWVARSRATGSRSLAPFWQSASSLCGFLSSPA
jgi:tellurite resistance protein TehA-like permease